MKKIFFLLFIISTLQTTLADDSQTYVRVDYGTGRFTNEKMDQHNANPSGSTIGASFGAKMSYVEMGFFYRNFNFKSDIVHDGLANQIAHDGKSFGLNMNVFLNNHLSLIVGYSFNNYTQKVSKGVSVATENAIKTLYGLESDRHSSNLFYGANLDIFAGKSFDFYVSALQFPMGSGKSALNAQVGIRLYMNSGLADFFGR